MMLNLTVENLCLLLHDISGRRGADEALDSCREFMAPEYAALLDKALALGHEITLDLLKIKERRENGN